MKNFMNIRELCIIASSRLGSVHRNLRGQRQWGHRREGKREGCGRGQQTFHQASFRDR